jgi:hypothetical protein
MVSLRLGRALGPHDLSTMCPHCTRASCSHAHRTVCLAATRGSRRRMRLTDFCFPTTRLRALASRRLPRWSPDFHRTPRQRTVRFTTLWSASAGPSFFAAAAPRSVLFCLGARRAEPLTPLSPPLRCPWRFRTHEPFKGRQDRFYRPPVKGNGFHDPRCLPSLGILALVPGRVSVTGTLGGDVPRPAALPPRSASRRLFARSFHPPFGRLSLRARPRSRPLRPFRDALKTLL